MSSVSLSAPATRLRARTQSGFGLLDLGSLGLILVLTLGHYRLPVFNPEPDLIRGIAPGPTYWTTSGIAIAGLWALVIVSATPLVTVREARFAVALMAYSLIATQIAWPMDERTIAGIIHISLAATCFPLGIFIGRRARQRPQFYAALAGTILFSTAIWGAVSIYQFTLPDDDGERATSLFQHPAEVGKLYLALLIFLLPATRQGPLRTRRMASTAVVMGIVAVMPTLSRANLVGIFAAFVVFFVAAPFRKLKPTTLFAIAVGLVASSYFVSELITRFASDPEGGRRPQFAAAARKVLPDVWLFGVGPNQFVPAVSRTSDIIRSSRQPVHNMHLLGIIDLGLIGYLLLMAPLIITGLRALKIALKTKFGRNRWPRPAELIAASTLAVLVGMVPTSITGWGNLLPPALYLSFLMFGFARAGLTRRTEDLARAPR